MNKDFWKATGVRCLRSFISVIMGGWTAGTLITEVNWKLTFLAAISTTIYIFLACILAGLPEVKLADTLYTLDNDPDEEDDIEEVGDGTEDDEEGGE